MKARPFLYSRPTSSGKYTIYFRVTDRGQKKTVAITDIDKSMWDESKCRVKGRTVEAMQINDQLTALEHKAHALYVDCRNNRKPFSPDAVFQKNTQKEKLSHFLTEYMNDLNDQDKVVSATKVQVIINKIRAFRDPLILHVDEVWIKGYVRYWRHQGNSTNTNSRDLSVIRAVCNRLLKQQIISINPFQWYKLKYTKVFKDKLTREELIKFQHHPVSERLDKARDIFMMSFFMRGCRVRNVLLLKWEDIKDGRISYESTKTGKVLSIQIGMDIRNILDKYRQSPSPVYIFPYMEGSKSLTLIERHNLIKRINARVNMNLKRICNIAGIDKNISMHTARHTFASIAGKSGVSSIEIQALLDHSSLSQTEDYLRELRESDELDKAANLVFGRIDGRLN